jgi:hypothetical protein
MVIELICAGIIGGLLAFASGYIVGYGTRKPSERYHDEQKES